MLILQCVESSTSGQTGVTYYVGQAGADGGRTRKSDAIDRHYVQVLTCASLRSLFVHEGLCLTSWYGISAVIG